ncbi:HD domain-containing protein [bacterium]|nr:HD domain-containing protein [bacterium]
MNKNLRAALIAESLQIIDDRGNDPSHDGNHALQVLKNVEQIAQTEGGDLDILIPAALLHDVVIYAKNDPRSDQAPAESAELTKQILESHTDFPKEKIPLVMEVIERCSFNKTEEPATLEGKILRDADKLEATGAVSIMRTFSSGGQMGRPLYNREDPFAENRSVDAKSQSLDLFYERLLIAKDRMYTKTAIEIADQRTGILHAFLEQLKKEI